MISQDDPDLIIFSGSMLMNRVQREAQAVAASFDLITRDAVAHIEEMYGLAAALLYMGFKTSKDSGDELRHTCAIVLTNAMKSLSAAFALLRTGWRLQPNLCIRNGMEAASVVIHLIRHPDDLQKFKDGGLKSSATLKGAKAALPVMGQLYGILSNEFVHVGRPFWHIQKANEYAASELEMWQNLAGVASFALVLYVVTELLFLSEIAEPQCWRRVGEVGYEQYWSDKIKTWREEFVRIYGPHHQKK